MQTNRDTATMSLRFTVYKHKLVYKENRLVQRNLIVLKVGEEIIGWTNLHLYVRGGGSRNITSNETVRFHHVVKLLNYVFFENYHIRKLTNIRLDMVKAFLNDYGLCRLPSDNESTHRSKETVETCIANVMSFLELMIQKNSTSKMKISELYLTEKKYSKQQKRYITIKKPAFEVLYLSSKRPALRNLPESVFQIIFNQIIASHMNLLMLVALGSFAGLRPSEACNVRRIDSRLGPGLRFEAVDGEVVNIFIDLKSELVLRSDLISVGGIKKERTQRVYPAFLKIFTDCYQKYMTYIEGKKYEADFGALTTGREGKAYTYASYIAEFHKAVEECIPDMLSNSDPEVVNYGHLLLEQRISPHIFRHWFSVKLTLYGEGIEGLMFWRGDKSPESALIYINNKSDLEKQYEKVSSEIFDYSIWKAAKLKEM